MLSKHEYLLRYETNFWVLAKFSFQNCDFKKVNYKQFDQIVNQMFKLIKDELRCNKRKEIFCVLNKILDLEIRKEIQIPKFEEDLVQLFSDRYFTDSRM